MYKFGWEKYDWLTLALGGAARGRCRIFRSRLKPEATLLADCQMTQRLFCLNHSHSREIKIRVKIS